MPLLTYCGGVKEAFEGKKRSDQSDEFLVKKKNPLQMPPDINKLPTPGNTILSAERTICASDVSKTSPFLFKFATF